MKVHIVSYQYNETYCSPYPENWEKQTSVLIVTTDLEKAKTVKEGHDTVKPFNRAEITTHELVP